MKLKQFIQQETVLTAAAVLAVVSAFFVPPDAQYLGYIDSAHAGDPVFP